MLKLTGEFPLTVRRVVQARNSASILLVKGTVILNAFFLVNPTCDGGDSAGRVFQSALTAGFGQPVSFYFAGDGSEHADYDHLDRNQ
jgi:hypothetical protein